MRLTITQKIIAVSLLVCFSNQLSYAANDPRNKAVVEAALTKAQQCSARAAEAYAKVASESADTLSVAAFDKCLDDWTAASEALTAYESVDKNAFSPQEKAANPYLGSIISGMDSAAADRNSVPALREKEVRRLRVIIIDQRLK